MNELEWAFEERIRLLLEDEEWHKAEKLCSEKLSSFPNNAYACLGLLMAGHRISSIDKINEFPEIVNDLLYQKLLANADESLIQKLKTSFFKPEKTNSSNTPKLSEQKSFTPNNDNINLTQLFKRALLALEDGDFPSADRFSENILNNDAENAQAYLIKLMIESRVKSRSDLGRLPKSFEDSGNFKKAIRFGNQELKDELNGYLEQIEHNIKYPVYAHGCEEMNKVDIASLEKAISVFNSITDFKDSKNKIEECKARIKDITYDKACKMMNESYIASLEKAISVFNNIIDFKDSKNKIEECKVRIKDITYNKACEMMNENSIEANEEAIKLFSSLIDLGSTFKNSGNNIEICRLNIKKIKYNNACKAMEEKSYVTAIELFASIGDYKDSKEKLKECKKRERISNCIPIICIVAFILFLMLIPVLSPYYYRLTFYKIISEGKYEKLEPLLSNSDFIEHATPEQGQKVLEFVIEHNNFDIDKKLALFDLASFKKYANKNSGEKNVESIVNKVINSDNETKFRILEDSRVINNASKEQVIRLVDSIIENIAKDDKKSRYRLLENEKIKQFWNNDQAQNLLKAIADSFKPYDSNEIYDFLSKSYFKQYGTKELGESIIASMTPKILNSSVFEKINFMSNESIKKYISPKDRQIIIYSVPDSSDFNKIDNTSLDKYFFEICNQQELESICKKIKDQISYLPESFLSWGVNSKVKETPEIVKIDDISEKNIIYELIKNKKDKDLAKIYILGEIARSINYWLEKDYKNKFSQTQNIIDKFPWAFDEKIKNMMDSLKEGIEIIEQIEKGSGSSAYSTTHNLKTKKDNIPNPLKLQDHIEEHKETVNTLRFKISDILYKQASNLKYEKALADYKKDKNNITALETLGDYYYFKERSYSNKNDKNLQEAIKFYKLAADMNSEIACGRLLNIYGEELNDDKNYVYYLKKFVDYFHRDGRFAGDLGRIYLLGSTGVSINKKLAIKYLKKSDNPYDLYLLGNIYYEGDSVKKDLIIAARYYREALEYNKTDEYYSGILDENNVTEKATSRLNKINKLLETKTKEEISELSINEIEQKLNSNNEVYYVSTKSGINLRDIPSTKGNKVGKLANKTKITVLSKDGPEEVIENIRSNWYKVTDGKITGWCFGGFVSITNY